MKNIFIIVIICLLLTVTISGCIGLLDNNEDSNNDLGGVDDLSNSGSGDNEDSLTPPQLPS